jgi:uncharacterized cofD-like protein
MAKKSPPTLTNREALSSAFLPGPGIKRWLLLFVISVLVLGFGLALLLLASGFGAAAIEDPGRGRWLAGGFLVMLGGILAAIAIWRMNRNVIHAFVPGEDKPGDLEVMATVFASRPRRHSGPKVVVIGGGTGMPQLLRGLRAYTDHITAVVTVADDGGSSGRLRRQMGMLPPGDFRNNIAALSEAEELMTRLFQYRFGENDFVGIGEGGSELAGHSFGNLFIATMAVISGSFVAGLAESSRVLAVRGRVLPSTLENVTLCAEVLQRLPDGGERWLTVEGESNIPEAGGRITRVFLKPDTVRAYPEVIQAILQADLIVAGPGSFYTSVMPNLLVPAIRDAICAAVAPRIYVCNVATQRGETDDFTVSDHMRALRLHAGDAFTTVLANHNYTQEVPPYPGGQWVPLPDPEVPIDYQLFTGDLVHASLPSHHDPTKVAARLMDIYATLRPQGTAAYRIKPD